VFKNILLPVDGSHFSEIVLPLAVSIARRSNAHLHLVRVHVQGVPTAESIVVANYDALLREWEHDALMVTKRRAEAAGVSTSANILDGNIVGALQEYVALADIDLVVMTTHGRSGIPRAVMGSVAEQCVRKTQVPILLVRPSDADDSTVTEFVGIERILVPLDGSVESESVLPDAIALASLFDAELILARAAIAPFEVVVTIGPAALTSYLAKLSMQAEEYLAGVMRTLPRDLKASYTTLSADSASQSILRCAKDCRADLIAMATHGRSGWARVAVGSVAETVLHKSTTPVLLIKGTTERASTGQRPAQTEPAHCGGGVQASP
jgi:nucleotide-binding universal stress UspA family protein